MRPSHFNCSHLGCTKTPVTFFTGVDGVRRAGCGDHDPSIPVTGHCVVGFCPSESVKDGETGWPMFCAYHSRLFDPTIARSAYAYRTPLKTLIEHNAEVSGEKVGWAGVGCPNCGKEMVYSYAASLLPGPALPPDKKYSHHEVNCVGCGAVRSMLRANPALCRERNCPCCYGAGTHEFVSCHVCRIFKEKGPDAPSPVPQPD